MRPRNVIALLVLASSLGTTGCYVTHRDYQNWRRDERRWERRQDWRDYRQQRRWWWWRDHDRDHDDD